MKKFNDFCNKLGNDGLNNIEIIMKEMDTASKSGKNEEYVYLLSTLLISECIKSDVKNKEVYVNLANLHRNKYVEYLASKQAICFGNRDWDGVIYYSNKALEVLSTPNEIDGYRLFEFTNFEDAYVFSRLNSEIKFRWVQLKDAYFWFKKAIAYKKQKKYVLALDCLDYAQSFDPMSFAIHQEIIDISYKQKHFTKMLKAIKLAHNFAYTKLHLASLLISQAKYYLYKKQYIVAKACLAYALNYDNSMQTSNEVMNIVAEIKEEDTQFEVFESIEEIEDVLVDNKVLYRAPSYIIDIISQYYFDALTDKKTSKNKQKIIRKMLLNISDKNVVDIVEYEVYKKLKLYIDKQNQIRFSLPLNFKISPNSLSNTQPTKVLFEYKNTFIYVIINGEENQYSNKKQIKNLGEMVFINKQCVKRYLYEEYNILVYSFKFNKKVNVEIKLMANKIDDKDIELLNKIACSFEEIK